MNKTITKVLLALNTFFCSNTFIVELIVKSKYNKVIDEVIEFCTEKKRYLFKKDDLIAAVVLIYFQTKRKDRLFIHQYITSFKTVPDVSYAMQKSQRRNERCDCGSGLKFKNCCLKKY